MELWFYSDNSASDIYIYVPGWVIYTDLCSAVKGESI
jgi:hypothetical protein